MTHVKGSNFKTKIFWIKLLSLLQFHGNRKAKQNQLVLRTYQPYNLRVMAKTWFVYNHYIYMYVLRIGPATKRSGTFNRLPIKGKKEVYVFWRAFFSMKLFKKK